MNLNLPVYDRLAACKNILIAGMGGGFDVFCGLPIYFELLERGHNVHLANYSFSDISALKGGIRLTPTLVGVQADQQDFAPYFPELYLSQWFKLNQQADTTIWSFHKVGTRTLLKDYRTLIDHLKIDGLLMIDGGVDSLVRGDEDAMGTAIEDAISLYVADELTEIPVRLLGCIAFGSELDLTHTHILENIADLTKANAFLGACALAPQMTCYQLYESAALYAQSRPHQDASVINSSIISAVRGHFGDYHLTKKTKRSSLWINPLMSLYWFFDLPAVAAVNQLLPILVDTDTFMEAARLVMWFQRTKPKRRNSKFPL